ncbi:imelysin family protein [Mycoplana dimorpha]|uniref:Putative iron-regulated protein n=1 Tax=Mycoplana dimorpha TaxID=28320 RepID=A0A2T5BEP8_MYCDI|nr:imelysin family protein [Mycoplana dimorpha]PTM97464.1 putative iron-regulated protein [Mycoplana dimorpha]
MTTSFLRSTALALLAAIAAPAAQPAFAATEPGAIVAHYVEVAHAKFTDSLAAAKELAVAVDQLIADPNDETLTAARTAWIKARVPYQQTEVYRFGNAVVDEWEGKVNAWPLDEGLIDYVDASYGSESEENALFVANVIANPTIRIDGKEVDATKLTPEFLAGTLQEAGGVEANVATGYHAIEFLLWGQDLNGTGPGAGKRPATDFDTKNCTGGNCERRAAYLKAATGLLVADLGEMVAQWAPQGGAAKTVSADPKAGLSAILTGMGSLSYGELAGERMKLGLMLHDSEEEHDCFSDNTHNSHYYDAVGIRSAYTGEYVRPNGTRLTGPSLSELVAAKDAALDAEMKAKLDTTIAAMQAMVKRAETVEAYDQMIGEGNAEGNATVQAAIDGLVAQSKTIERVISALDLGTIELEGSDSLDNPNAVFQ